MTLKLLHVQVSLVLVAYYKQLHVERRYTIPVACWKKVHNSSLQLHQIRFKTSSGAALVPFDAITGINSLLFWSFPHSNLKVKRDRMVTCRHDLRANFYFLGTRLFQIGCASISPKHTLPHPLRNTHICTHTHTHTHTYTHIHTHTQKCQKNVVFYKTFTN